MANSERFVHLCVEHGLDFWTGVPCSYLSPLIAAARADKRVRFIMATGEGEATGIAAGASLAGRKTVVFCQNSGLGNMVNPLTSLNRPYRIPSLIIVSQRGGPEDEPQHSLMGEITESLLDVMGVPWRRLRHGEACDEDAITWAVHTMKESGQPVALVCGKGAFAVSAANTAASSACAAARSALEPAGSFNVPAAERETRAQAIRQILSCLDGSEVVVATTGKIWREALGAGNRDSHFYSLGSMGCAGAIGLGIHESTNRTVLVLDGDGAALMKMGAFATIGREKPVRFIHVILDNEVYETTGGQPTASSTTDLCRVALACGYRSAWRADVCDLLYVTQECLQRPGPALLHTKVSPTSDPRMPGLGCSLPEHAARFSGFLSSRKA